MIETRPTPIVTCLAGDGIGPEVMAEAGRVIETVSDLFGIRVRQVHLPFGGEAIDRHHDPFPSDVPMEANAVDTDALDDDAFFASLREAVRDDAPLGPRDDDQATFFDGAAEDDRRRFRRRR